MSSGTVGGSGNAFLSDAAVGGTGGYGGHGGVGGTARGLGTGGFGGFAGGAFGGGLFVGGGTVSLAATPFTNDLARGGKGGTGGIGGLSHAIPTGSTSSNGVFIGRGGAARSASGAAGGAVYVNGGSLTLGAGGSSVTDIEFDRAIGGFVGFTGNHRENVTTVSSPGHGAARLLSRRPVKAPSDPPLNGDVHKHAGNGADGRHHLDRPGDRGAADASSSSSSSGNGLSFGDAGGLYVAGGSVTLFNQDVSKDAANYGGGIFINSGAWWRPPA